MNKNLTIHGETLAASQEGTLAAEQFLQEHYFFRRNVLSGKVEFAVVPSEGEPQYRVLTQEALNSIIIRAKREEICEKGSPKTEITELIHSEEVPEHRIPGISTEQHAFLATWIRAVVAHWLQMDTLHGNECVPTLIGAQGCGKTTFVARLLPPELRQYFLDHLNLSNKFDKEMALTNNLIVCLDELEAILKQTLSKSKVNGRPIYGCAQEDRPRYASFVATTNNYHPLTDATGSRRYICLTIPEGMFIDNTGEIDYQQLYAQVLYEIREKNAPYWFNNEEVARIQELNLDYMEKKDIAEIIVSCFRKPEEGESGKRMNSSEILKEIRKEYPSIPNTVGSKVNVGQAMKLLGYEHTECSHVKYYRVVPINAA